MHQSSPLLPEEDCMRVWCAHQLDGAEKTASYQFSPVSPRSHEAAAAGSFGVLNTSIVRIWRRTDRTWFIRSAKQTLYAPAVTHTCVKEEKRRSPDVTARFFRVILRSPPYPLLIFLLWAPPTQEDPDWRKQGGMLLQLKRRTVKIGSMWLKHRGHAQRMSLSIAIWRQGPHRTETARLLNCSSRSGHVVRTFINISV